MFLSPYRGKNCDVNLAMQLASVFCDTAQGPVATI
jgi:hypothetical protein